MSVQPAASGFLHQRLAGTRTAVETRPQQCVQHLHRLHGPGDQTVQGPPGRGHGAQHQHQMGLRELRPRRAGQRKPPRPGRHDGPVDRQQAQGPVGQHLQKHHAGSHARDPLREPQGFAGAEGRNPRLRRILPGLLVLPSDHDLRRRTAHHRGDRLSEARLPDLDPAAYHQPDDRDARRRRETPSRNRPRQREPGGRLHDPDEILPDER